MVATPLALVAVLVICTPSVFTVIMIYSESVTLISKSDFSGRSIAPFQ